MRYLLHKTWVLIIPCLALLLLYTFSQYFFAKWYTHKYYYTFIFSFLIGSLAFYKLLKLNNFYSTFRHELCHWLISILCLNKPKGFSVNPNGSGHFLYEGRNNIFINLAPYYLPITTLVILLLQFFMNNKPQWYFVLIGVVFAFDLISSAKDYKSYQTDWKESGGSIISVLFSISMAIIVVICFLTILFKGWDGLWILLQRVWMVFSSII